MGTMDLSSADKRRRASDSEVNQLITKMVILNGSAIVSSFTSLMIYLFTHFVTAVDLDVGVTAACVILATSKHHKSLYKRLCRYVATQLKNQIALHFSQINYIILIITYYKNAI